MRRLVGWLVHNPHWLCDRKPCDDCLRLHAQILREATRFACDDTPSPGARPTVADPARAVTERDPWSAIYCMDCAAHLGHVDGPIMGSTLCDDCWAVQPAPAEPEHLEDNRG